MYLILCWSYLNHSLRFVGEKKEDKKKSHIKSQSQYFGKKSQLDYFPKSFSPSTYFLYIQDPKGKGWTPTVPKCGKSDSSSDSSLLQRTNVLEPNISKNL